MKPLGIDIKISERVLNNPDILNNANFIGITPVLRAGDRILNKDDGYVVLGDEYMTFVWGKLCNIDTLAEALITMIDLNREELLDDSKIEKLAAIYSELVKLNVKHNVMKKCNTQWTNVKPQQKEKK